MTRLRTSTSFVALPLNAAAPPLGNLEGAQPSPSMPCTSNLGPETSPHQLHSPWLPGNGLRDCSKDTPCLLLHRSSKSEHQSVVFIQLLLLCIGLISCLRQLLSLASLHNIGSWDASVPPPLFFLFLFLCSCLFCAES